MDITLASSPFNRALYRSRNVVRPGLFDGRLEELLVGRCVPSGPPQAQTKLRGAILVLLDAVAELGDPSSGVAILEIPDECHNTVRLKDPCKLGRCRIVIRAPVEGLELALLVQRGTERPRYMWGYLRNRDEICPRVVDMGGVEGAITRSQTWILRLLVKDLAHASARLESLDLGDTLSKVRMLQESARE